MKIILLLFLGLFACKHKQDFSQTTAKKYRSYKNFPISMVGAYKMNVVYVGVDNPLGIVVNAIPPEDLLVEAIGCGATLKIDKTNRWNWHYTLNVQEAGEVKIILKEKKSNSIINCVYFRSKRIPDPVVRLGRKTGGAIGTGEMRAQLGLIPELENFDFEARCAIQSFTLYYTARREEPVEIKATGGRFTGAVLEAIKKANIGDQYQFVDMRVSCPGDAVARALNSLAFTIK